MELCDPFTFFDFYERQLWLNLILVLAIDGIVLFAGYFLFVRKYRERRAKMVYNKDIVEEHARINKDPLKMKKK